MPEQRRLVTILFADVTGSTALGESLDPEDVRALMGRYFAHARQVVANHGGTLEKFIGDAVMAVFGLTHAWGDDAERALAAALALRAAIAEDSVLAKWLKLRMGVNTGEVVATDDASRNDFLITGDAVNIAARLEQHAAPGEILASERTVAAARAAFAFGPARAIEAKGKSLPLRVFPLTERQTRRPTVRPPPVGRRQNLLQLEVLKARALEERQPQILTIVAPAGVGKTRLVEEFLTRLDPVDGMRAATLRCQSYGETLTFAPLRGLLHELLGDTNLPQRITDVFLADERSAEEAASLARYVLQPLGNEQEGSADRESIFTAWRLLLEAIARRAPHVILFEDLHWASDSLLDLIEQIMRPRTPAPLLLIALSRPELLDRRPTWGSGQRNTILMTLQPLSDEQTSELVARLTEGMPDKLCASVAARAAGNPFFAIELARTLAERKARGDTLPAETLPDTVHAAVQARLDLLAPDERAAVQAASVVGQTFTEALLRVVAPEHTPEAMGHILEALLAHDLFIPAGVSAYSFRHALIREVAYGALARSERMRLHAALASWLDQQPAEGDVNTLELAAYHYRQAITLAHQSAVPLEAPIEVPRAVAALERAGVQAGRAGAFTEARDYLSAAITIAPPAEHARLYERLGDDGGWGESAVTAFRQALDQWRASGARDPLTGARLLRKILIFSLRTNVQARPTSQEAAALRAEAERLITQADDENERWHLRVADLFMSGSPDIGSDSGITMADGMEAASYFEAKGEWQSFSEALDGCALFALRNGSMTDALAVSQRRLTAPELPASERNDAIAMVIRAYLALSEFDKAIAAIWEALASISPGATISYLSDAIWTVGLAIWLSGRWDELDQLKRMLREKAGAADDRVAQSLINLSFGTLQIALCREDTAQAEASFATIEKYLAQDRFPNDYALLQLYRTDDSSRARLHQQTIQLAGPTIWLMLLHMCERDLSIPPDLLALAQSDQIRRQMSALVEVASVASALSSENWEALANAINAAEARGLIPFAAHMRVVLARRTNDATPLRLARPVLERLGDTLFLRQLEQIAGGSI